MSGSSKKTEIRYYSGKWNADVRPRRLLTQSWGAFHYFIEVEGQHVVRQVNVFENGFILRYDTTHWCDKFGSMFIGKLSLKLKAGKGMVTLTAAEFQKAWIRAIASPLWSEQQAHAMMSEWGTWEERMR